MGYANKKGVAIWIYQFQQTLVIIGAQGRT